MRHVDIDGLAMIMSIRVGSISTVPMFKTFSSKMVRSFNVTLIGEDAYMQCCYRVNDRKRERRQNTCYWNAAPTDSNIPIHGVGCV